MLKAVMVYMTVRVHVRIYEKLKTRRHTSCRQNHHASLWVKKKFYS